MTVDQPFYMDMYAEHAYMLCFMIAFFFFKYAFSYRQPQPRHHKCTHSLLALNILLNLSSQSGHSVANELDSFHSVGFKSESSIVKLV